MDCSDGVGKGSLDSNSETEYEDEFFSPGLGLCPDQGSGQGHCQSLAVAPESQEHNQDPEKTDAADQAADGTITVICPTSEFNESESEALDLEDMELFESNVVDVQIPTGCGPGTFACISCCSLTQLLDTVETVNQDLAEQVSQGRKRKREKLEQDELLQEDEWTGEFDEPDKGGGPQTPSEEEMIDLVESSEEDVGDVADDD